MPKIEPKQPTGGNWGRPAKKAYAFKHSNTWVIFVSVGDGMWVRTFPVVLESRCPDCNAEIGQPCRDYRKKRGWVWRSRPHPARKQKRDLDLVLGRGRRWVPPK